MSEVQVPCVILEGSAYERGWAHGKQVSSLIHQNITSWKQYLERRHSVSGEFLCPCLTISVCVSYRLFKEDKLFASGIESLSRITAGSKRDC